MRREERIKTLYDCLQNKILLLDGATGTAFQKKNLKSKDFGGKEFVGCYEKLNVERPDVIIEHHNQYLEAGADIIQSNTFGAGPIVLKEYGIQGPCYEINKKAAKLARKCADTFTKKNPTQPRFVAGTMGPTTKVISLTGGITFEELIDNYYQQARGLYDGEIDYFLLETCNDTRSIKAGIFGIQKLLGEKNDKLPIAVSCTIEKNGTMLAGQPIEALTVSLEHFDLLYLGLNCGTGPGLMADHLRALANMANTYTACVPNAGLPNENGEYLETPEMMKKTLQQFMAYNQLNLIGGCCGTTPEHIKALAQIIKNHLPRKITGKRRSLLSGIDFLEVSDEKRPVLVGERTNVIGSKKFRDLITEKKFDEASEIAKGQVKKGADIIDICLANPDSNELSDMENFLKKVVNKVQVPLMIDSTDEKVVELALTYSQGKSIINSINLENGEERFDKIIPLAKKYGAALVVGTIDDHPEHGMALTAERKLEVARRSHKLLVEKYNINQSDIYWDPLVFPCATGDQQYIGAALETIKGLELIKKEFPLSKILLGVSNVSFGLPPLGRKVLNSVFMYNCVKAGCDVAIINTQSLIRYSELTQKEIELSENVLWGKGENHIKDFVEHFRDKKSLPKKDLTKLSVEKKLALHILEGTKKGLDNDLEEMLKTKSPIEIINGPLMNGMKKVGQLFNENKLIVAEVLQSAESMKAAVSHLEPLMKKDKAKVKNKVVIATVKGDVHDIGKNLVDIILSNNGFHVINLGIKVSSEQIIQAVREHDPQIIGLSALLVKTAYQMAQTAKDLHKEGIKLPILVGGAALSEKFTIKNIASVYPDGHVFYAKDAMEGLQIANMLSDNEKLNKYLQDKKIKKENLLSQAKKQSNSIEEKSLEASSSQKPKVAINLDPPSPPDFKRHIITDTPIEEIWEYLNPLMLYSRHLGINGKLARLISEGKFQELTKSSSGNKALEIHYEVEKIKKRYKKAHLIPSAIYKFFKCNSKENSISIYNDDRKDILATFQFPRQFEGDKICLSDYIIPEDKGVLDNLAIFIVSVGKEVHQEITKLKHEGKYLHSHILISLALESAEGYAELLHSKIRSWWGFPDPENMTMMERFQAKYRGKRYSFGYPACPRISDQKILFDLLGPTKDIGVTLTENYMMTPNSTVSAIVFHHEDAKYFSVGDRDIYNE